MNLAEYYELYGRRITQDSERLFVDDFLYPLLSAKIENIVPQYPFIDTTGKSRRIDFVYRGSHANLALEVNGESYHAEGIIPNETFDDNLFRQNEILRLGYRLVRFSYSQLQSPTWRPIVHQMLKDFFASYAPELLTEYKLNPTPLQREALEALDFYRNVRNWRKGVVVLPTGTGKTVLSALDARSHGGRVLFLVHRLDILWQSVEAYKLVWPDMRAGFLTGEQRENELDCDVLFASKDTLRQTDELMRFSRDWFDYIVVDEVHHGQSPTYREILTYFDPKFMLGMTATPDRTDRRDIFELFDYSKVYEVSLADAIERGYLVPYTYYGLRDNVDYSRIRYQNNRYSIGDLERHLIIPERNNAIVVEYLDKGHGDKAIGFCVSIRHAERMAEVFNQHGILAHAIHSESPNRDELIASFRNNEFNVAFTVDLFNEGIDIPNVQVLLFLRPTESKTVFLQQLGRGLRLSTGKKRVRVLDFIGNYQRANQVRSYLARSRRVIEVEENGRRRRKVEYTYSLGCEVVFDPSVEEILERQDAEDLGISELELQEAYFALAETLGRKPSRADLDAQGEYRSGLYTQKFGSWTNFLRSVGEYTEASYHYPQGVHIGHLLSILKIFHANNRTGTHFDDKYIRLRGNYGSGRIGTYQRQVKFKLQAAMELGILTDDRKFPAINDYVLELTPLGEELYGALNPLLQQLDLAFPVGKDGIPTSQMQDNQALYNQGIRNLIHNNTAARQTVYRVFLRMPAVQQMLTFLYHIVRSQTVSREEIYQQFFHAPFVRQFCDQEGIESATEEAARHRCPFLLNILDACGIIDTDRHTITVNKLVLLPSLVAPYAGEDKNTSLARLHAVHSAWPNSPELMDNEDLSIVRELFGADFLTDRYYLRDLEVFEV